VSWGLENNETFEIPNRFQQQQMRLPKFPKGPPPTVLPLTPRQPKAATLRLFAPPSTLPLPPPMRPAVTLSSNGNDDFEDVGGGVGTCMVNIHHHRWARVLLFHHHRWTEEMMDPGVPPQGPPGLRVANTRIRSMPGIAEV
jgi:hypothetical protein